MITILSFSPVWLFSITISLKEETCAGTNNNEGSWNY